MISSCLRNHELIYILIKREILSRYKGSIFGVFWSFFQPLLMLAVYTFVFNITLNSSWNIEHESKAEFALILFSGLILFNLFSECISRAPSLITTHPNYVKKVVFPLEILPCVAVGAAFFQSIISFGVWLLFYICLYGTPHYTLIFLPYVLFPLILIIMGLSWFFASFGVYFRDIQPVVNIFMSVLMFISPIFYPLSALPTKYQKFLFINPLTPVIENMRNILYWGHAPSYSYLFYIFLSMGIAYLGFIWFQKTRKGFADVL